MASYLYPHSPGTFVQSVEMAAQTVKQGAKTGCMIGEVDVAYKAPTLMEPVYITSIPQLQAAFNLDSDRSVDYYENPLFEQAKRHLLAGGGALYVIPVGPNGTFLVTPTWATQPADVCEAIANHTGVATSPLTGGDWDVCITEYISTSHLVAKGETLASVIKTVTVADAPTTPSTQSTAIKINHALTNATADGISVYIRLAGNTYWFYVGDAEDGVDYFVNELPPYTLLKQPPVRNEAIVSQTAAPIDITSDVGSWEGGLDGAKGLFDISSVCIAGGYDHNGATPSIPDNLTLMSLTAKHADDMESEAYNKRMAIAPCTAAEVHADRIDPEYYGDYATQTPAYANIVSDRLLKCAFNGTEGYVSGAFCARTYMQGITYFPLPSCQPSELFQGGNSYPLDAADRDSEFAMGWILLKPFEDGVRVMRGLTSMAASATSNVFVELFVRTCMDYLFGQFERHGDAFIGSAVAIQSQEQRMSLQADFRGVLMAMQTAHAIIDFDVLVLPNADGMPNAVDVALSVTVNHEIEQIFIYATLGG